MWKKELLKNKLYALVLILIGLVPILIERDGTFYICFDDRISVFR